MVKRGNCASSPACPRNRLHWKCNENSSCEHLLRTWSVSPGGLLKLTFHHIVIKECNLVWFKVQIPIDDESLSLFSDISFASVASLMMNHFLSFFLSIFCISSTYWWCITSWCCISLVSATPKLYLSKLLGVFVQIAKCICPNQKIYLSKSKNIFVQTKKCICSNKKKVFV